MPTVSRRRVPRAERERQMLAVADRVFSTRGYHAASMDEIAEGVGVTKPMLYAYFGSKEGLYSACLERSGERLLDDLRHVADEPTAAERLRAGALAFFRFVEERRDAWSVLYAESTGAGSPFAERAAELRDRFVRAVGAMLEEDAEALAYAVVGAGESLALWWVRHPEESAEAMADRLLAVVWTGLERRVKG